MTYKTLYGVIEQFISHFIPLWNMTLSPLKTGWPLRIKYDDVVYDPDPENGPQSDGLQREEGEEFSAYWWRRGEWYAATRRIVLPEPGEFVLPNMENEGDGLRRGGVDLRRDFGQQGLQVIVKLANIELTPEKTKYDGGTWHVEGQLVRFFVIVFFPLRPHRLPTQNEHICATALYYYDNVNTTPSRLAFRQASDNEPDIDYHQHQHDWLPLVFGCEQDGSSVQNIGAVETREGRCITFPNILQHQVQPFELEDANKPGHRKILAVFLVDPHVRVISTAHVPCQQREWWAEELASGGTGLGRLPAELRACVVNAVEGFPIGLEEAKELRGDLMEERSYFHMDRNKEFEDDIFTLCEH